MTPQLLITLLFFQAPESPFSGPQPGEALPTFRLLMVNTADAGREVDYLARAPESPALVVFLHQLDRNVGALIQPVERYARDRAEAGLRTLYVFLCPDKVEGERRMQAVVRSLKLESAVGVSIDGIEGPGSFGLNRNVAVTALVAAKGKVTANFAIIQPGMVDAPRIIGAAAKNVGGKVLTVAELEAERDRARTMTRSAQQPEPKTTIAAVAWIAGAWAGTMEGTGGRAQNEEHWLPPAGGTMLGVSRTITGERMVLFEFLRIEQRADGVYYVAQPGGRPPTSFKLTRSSATEAVFENPEHDHPKIISYRQENDGLVATVEGDERGKHVKQEFRFRRTR